jgi:hypothetical protein
MYTYVVILIVGKRWKKSQEHFCGLGMKPFISFLIYQLKRNYDCNFHAIEQHNEHCDTTLPLETRAKFYSLSIDTKN